ncbi:MAG: anti-sigma factor [Vulcanimicrobiaceae bacterium]|jgi:anti-sigma-K factor RskA
MNDAGHDAMLDLVAVYALGAVNADDARIVSAHIAVCPECRKEYMELKAAADAIALSADDQQDAHHASDLKARVMKSIEMPKLVRIRVRDAVAVLALAAAVVFGLFSLNAERRLNDLQIASAQQYQVPGGEILKNGERVYLVMRTLPALPAGHVYQAWTLAPGAKSVAPSVTFVPDSRGFVILSLPEASANVSAVAISVEPTGGSQSPTTTPLFVRKV